MLKKVIMLVTVVTCLCSLHAEKSSSKLSIIPSVGLSGIDLDSDLKLEDTIGTLVLCEARYHFSNNFNLGLCAGTSIHDYNQSLYTPLLVSVSFGYDISEIITLGIDIGLLPAFNVTIGNHQIKFGSYTMFQWPMTGMTISYGYNFSL